MTAVLGSVGYDQLGVNVALRHPRVAVASEPLDMELTEAAVTTPHKPAKMSKMSDVMGIKIARPSRCYLSSNSDSTAQYTSSAAAHTPSDAEGGSLRLPWLVRLPDLLDAGDIETVFTATGGDAGTPSSRPSKGESKGCSSPCWLVGRGSLDDRDMRSVTRP